jgi:hypothetical protein
VTYIDSGSQFSLVGGGATTGADVPINPYAVPRLSLDGLIAHAFSLGLGVSVFTQSGQWSAEYPGGSVSGDGQKSWLVALSPRLGYLLPVGQVFALWGRLGASWAQQRISNPVVSTRAKLANADLELVWLFELVEHVGLSTTFGIALPLSGSFERDIEAEYATRNDYEAHRQRDVGLYAYGLQAGISGLF